MLLFHATNHFVIYENIDWFPLVGASTALIFLDADWPERFWKWLRHPKLRKPDLRWLIAGTILVPPFGAALGWKLKPSPLAVRSPKYHQLGPWVAPFVVVWLVWQALFPMREYLIPGDDRITREGLAFSWRLKADDHFALPVQMFVRDAKIISQTEGQSSRIDWNEWHGDKAIYRRVAPGKINWPQLPEIVVLLEPFIGERVIYNPFSGSPSARTEAQARERIGVIWQELYGHQPQVVRRTAPLSSVLDSISSALRIGGANQEAARLATFSTRAQRSYEAGIDTEAAKKSRGDLLGALKALRDRDRNGEILPFLRPIDPFAMEGEHLSPGSFFLIEDPILLGQSGEERFRLNGKLWKKAPGTRTQRSAADIYAGAEPLVVYMSEVGPDSRTFLPQACISDVLDRPGQAAFICWNSLKDIPISKFDHISNDPFYLRRYARRVAQLWEVEYGRRPAVNAITAESLNHRPFQLLVDPNADLASVPAKWFTHNDWIKDLETPRIPREALNRSRR